MKFKHYLIILCAISITVLALGSGCVTPPVIETSIIIANGDAIANDSTPTLTISAVGAVYMAFSGDENTWSEWVDYAETYSLFNMTTDAGCTTAEGIKTVYVKFKNTEGNEFGTCYDTIEYDITRPKLLSAVYDDVDSSDSVNSGDTITFTFDDEMKTSAITNDNLASRLPLSASTYGSGATVSWNTTGDVCTVTLGTSPDIPYDTTVNPSYQVTDAAGNYDNSSNITISGLTSITVLKSVTISPPSASTAEAGDTVTFTVIVLNMEDEDITDDCTCTWRFLGTEIGEISPTTGLSTVYTPPDSGTGTDTIKVTAEYNGETKSDTAEVTVTASSPADKLMVSAQKHEAKYTSLPEGATVVVYSWATNDAVAAKLDGAKATIDLPLNNPALYTGGDKDYIFFEMTGPEVVTLTADGRIPTAPNAAALTKIQATNENTITSIAAGNMDPTDKITLYVGGTAYSEPTLVGETITLSKLLVAGEMPTYTRTNTDGHESVVSLEDGIILQLVGALAKNGTGVEDVLDEGDLIILDFGGSVDVLSPIQVSNISWVASTSTAVLDDGTETLANTGTNLPGVILFATANCTDFATGEWVEFNILADTSIVDHIGGNQVLPADPVFTFHATDF